MHLWLETQNNDFFCSWFEDSPLFLSGMSGILFFLLSTLVGEGKISGPFDDPPLLSLKTEEEKQDLKIFTAVPGWSVEFPFSTLVLRTIPSFQYVGKSRTVP